MTKRTEAASKARHLNALRRKAPAMVEALRGLGYTVTEPTDVERETVWCQTEGQTHAGAHFLLPTECLFPHYTTPAMRARLNREARS